MDDFSSAPASADSSSNRDDLSVAAVERGSKSIFVERRYHRKVKPPAEYSFCPHCGSDLKVQFVPDEERDRLVCQNCGHIYYINPKIVAGTIPVSEGRVWLLRRAIEPRLGYWTFPAGFMEMGETVEQAAVRETREELNLDVRLVRLLSVYSWERLSTVHIVYLADALSQPTGGKETLEFRLFDVPDIPWGELAFDSTTAALRDWLDQPDSS